VTSAAHELSVQAANLRSEIDQFLSAIQIDERATG